MKIAGNEYDLREAAGAFGDLGTLIPFVVGYITIARMDPVGVLVAFGLFKIIAGLYFRTPVPIQPMKAIGTAAIGHAGAISPGAIWASGLFTGILWLVLGLTGAVTWIARLTSRPIVQGLVLGLGLTFVLEGVRMMEGDYLLAVGAAVLTFVLLSRERLPAMLALLVLGAGVAVAREPGLLGELWGLSFQLRLPRFALTGLGWEDIVTGVMVLGLPQAALTLGNAIIATVEENNTLFPDRRITVRTIAVDHGIMNLVGTGLGGVPMCHGAGGMAGHVRFGARTGGALVLLGILLLFGGLFLADSVATLFKLFPRSLLGVILLFGGLELAAGAHGNGFEKDERYVMLLTAGVSMWNMGAGYLAGLVLWHALRRGWLKA
ncbi:MAG: sulfate transporter [Candidatus Rokubacteria bacterium RIFCSPLOWO2_12_FULL_71_22]|nr:MAG: sulfate transporter [Candidatus Rokubacteria bacterium RIFCSPLOWO2_12_FULL_71_22]